MELLTAKNSNGKTHIPVIGMESDAEFTSNPYSVDWDPEIALRAYFKAEARGYEPGYELQDWLDAEAEIMSEAERRKGK